jgi:hypothetical protein
MPRTLLALALLAAGESAAAGSYELHHPDQYFRRVGADHLERGRHDDALRTLRIAARYADKPSQIMLSRIYWEGLGVRPDRAVAYVWLDLAAERGWSDVLVARERAWNALDERERERALAVGDAMYREFGDDVARHRLETRLAQGRRAQLGSRTGFMASRVRVFVFGLNGDFNGSGSYFSGDEYYADEHWLPESYWAEQERQWRTLPMGKVFIQPVKPFATGRRR